MHSLQDTLFFLLPPFTAWLLGWALTFAFRVAVGTIAIGRFASAGVLTTAAIVIVIDTLQGHSATAITAGFAVGILSTVVIAHILTSRSTPSLALAGVEAVALGSLVSAWHIRNGTQGLPHHTRRWCSPVRRQRKRRGTIEFVTFQQFFGGIGSSVCGSRIGSTSARCTSASRDYGYASRRTGGPSTTCPSRGDHRATKCWAKAVACGGIRHWPCNWRRSSRHWTPVNDIRRAIRQEEVAPGGGGHASNPSTSDESDDPRARIGPCGVMHALQWLGYYFGISSSVQVGLIS